MPCILLILALAFPRVVLLVLYLFTTYIQRAYHDLLLPLLGFIFLPLTTLVYAWIVNNHLPVADVYLVVLIVAAVIDVVSLGGGAYRRRW